MKIYSPLSVEECLNMLKSAVVQDTLFGTMFINSGSIIGKFNGESFRLRQKRSYGNAFGPYFYGKLRQTENGTEISGQFRIQPFVIAFMAFWFGAVLLGGGGMALSSLSQLITGHDDHAKNANFLLGILSPLIMLVLGGAMVGFGKWLGKSEEVKMTGFLQQMFSDNKTSPTAAFVPPLSPPKISMTRPLFFFVLLGLLSLISSFTGISSYHASASSDPSAHSGVLITYYHDEWGRWLAFATGIFLCLMAYGIWKRLYLVWKAGFALIALSAVNFVFEVVGDPNFLSSTSGFPLVIFILLISAGALAVGAFWTVWWYKKKDYFTQ
jgi:NADH:ubiquinone oxidoreductase subunit K